MRRLISRAPLAQAGQLRPLRRILAMEAEPLDWDHRFVNLSEDLADWTDWDGAAFLVGRVLGVFASTVAFTQVEYVFWTDNPSGNALHEVLTDLTAAGVLERREEPDEQFRWLFRAQGFVDTGDYAWRTGSLKGSL